jgi:uncharacterized GH25 family protein
MKIAARVRSGFAFQRRPAWRLVAPAVLACALAPALAAAEPIAVNGRIEDGAGRAPRDGVVRLYPLIGIRAVAEQQLAGSEPPSAKVEAKADAAGTFRIEAPGPGVWRLVASAPGRAPREAVLTPLVEETWLPAVELPADNPLEVTVTGADGKPLPRAAVVAQPVSVMFMRGAWAPVAERLSTDARGVAVAHRGKGRVDVAIGAAGYALVEQKGISGGSLHLALRREPSRELLVVNPGGRPIAGAVVLATPSYAPLAISDAAGRVALPLAAKESLGIVVEDGAGARARLTLQPLVPGERPRPQRVQLERTAALAGRVIDAESRQPIAGAVVYSAQHLDSWTLTDRAGGYTVERMPVQGRVWLQAMAAGHFGANADLALVEGASRPAPTLALPPASALSGSVTDPKGKPLSDVEVEAAEVQSGPRMMFRARGPVSVRARTDARGRFRLSPLSTDSPQSVRFRRAGYAPLEKEVAPSAADRFPELHVSLAQGARGVGRVLSAGDRPLPGAKVTLEPVEGRPSPMARFRRMREGAKPAAEATTDASGRFTLADLAAGRFVLTVEAEGHAPTTVPGVEVPADSGEVDLGTVKLAPGSFVEGRVVGPRGEPIEGAEIFAIEGAGGMSPDPRWMLPGRDPAAASAADGFFRVGDRAAGAKVDLVARKEAYSLGRLSGVTAPTAEPVTVTMAPASAVRGRVADEGGEPVSGAHVLLMVERAGGGFGFQAMEGNGESGDDGRFAIEGVEPGTVRVTVSAPGYLPLERSGVEVPAGKDLEGLDLVVRAGASVVGTVFAPDGRPAVGAQVRLVEEDGDRGGRMMFFGGGEGQTDGDGGYRLEAVAVGEQTVEATHADYDRGVATLTVRQGENRLDLRLRGGQQVSGRVVVGPLGQPVGGATVTLSHGGWSWGEHEARSDEAGQFVIDGVPDGGYEAVATHPDFGDGRAAAQVNVAGAPVAGVTVELAAGAAVVGALRGLSLAELSQVRVSAVQEAGRWREGSVSYDGRYRVAGLAPGEWTLSARVEGAGKQTRGRVSIAAGSTEETLDLEFEGGLALSGVVRAAGRPVDGAVVLLRGQGVPSGGSTRADFTGRYRIENLRLGDYEVEVFAPQSGMRHHESLTLDADRELDFELRSTRIAGVVLDAESGDPVSGAMVKLEPAEEGPADFVPFGGEVATDDDGRFAVGAAGDGSWRLGVQKAGYARGETAVSVSGESIEGLEVRLRPTQGVTLEVSRLAGAPPAEVQVAVLDGAGRFVSGGGYTTGENGRVRLSTLPPGSWELLVRSEDSATARVTALSPGPTVGVVLAPQAILTVVVPALAKEATIADLKLTGPDGRAFAFPGWRSVETTLSIAWGRAVIHYLPAGTWKVEVTAGDGRRFQGSTTTVAGTSATVELD